MHKVEFENVTLWHGDCLEVMPLIPDGVDAVIADLPYGTTACKWDAIIPFEPLWKEYLRASKDSAAIVLTASQPFTAALIMSNAKIFRHEWIWQKNRGSNFANTVREPMKEHESVLVFSRGQWTYNKQMQERSAGGLSRVAYDFTCHTKTENYGTIGAPAKNQGELRVPSSVQKFNTEVGLHPTQKPVQLFDYLVRTYSNKGDLVLDNSMGSGTTGIACIRTGRRFIGIEKDPVHFATACKRIEQELSQGQLAL